MRIQFEIKEKLPEIIEEIMNSGKWQTSVKEELSGRTTVVIRDQAYGSEATIEIYAKSIEIKTAWSKYSYRIFVANDIVWCEYNGAYRGLLERNGSQNTTSNDEDQHVADAVHEVLIDDVADGLLLLDLVLDIGGSSNRVVALGGERAVD